MSYRKGRYQQPRPVKLPQFTIKVNHLPSHANSDDLCEVYSKYGSIDSVKMMESSESLEDTEFYAFINYNSKASAMRAKEETNGRMVLGKVVRVMCKWEGALPTPPSVEQHTIKITNLSRMVTQEEMETVCRAYLDYQSLKVNVGYAFVNFVSRNGAERAMEHLKSLSFYGQPLLVKFHYTSSSPSSSPCQNEILSSFPHSSVRGPPPHKSSVPWRPRVYISRPPGPRAHISCPPGPRVHISCPPGPPHSLMHYGHPPPVYSGYPPYRLPSPLPGNYPGSTFSPQLGASTNLKVTIKSPGISSEDLEGYFSQFGEVLRTPTIKSGSPDFAYVNFKTNQEAMAACKEGIVLLKGVQLNIKLSNKVAPASVPDKETKVIKCASDPLVGLILSTCTLAELETKLANVFLKPSKDGGGVLLSGDKDKVLMAESIVNLHMDSIKTMIIKETAHFPCQYIPLLGNPQIFQDIERKRGVELSILLSDGSSKSLITLSSTVAALSYSSYPITLESITEYLSSTATTPSSVSWEFVDDTRTFTPMSTTDSTAVEELYQSQIKLLHSRGQWQYLYDFEDMTQTNTSTKIRRRIKRVASMAEASSLNLSCRGLPGNVEISLTELQEKLEDSMINKSLGNCSGTIKESLAELANSFCVEVDDSLVEGKIILSGGSEYLAKVLLVLTEKQVCLQVSIHSSSSFPPEWEAQENDIELKSVAQRSREWIDIDNEVRKTLCVKISRIERIQNKFLYTKYDLCKRRMQHKNGGVVNDKRLFHGSSSTPPEKIYRSEHGFDFRLGNSGMWGRGAYFAVKAGYSGQGYAYSSVHGKQIFMAFVLTGFSTTVASNSSLVVPPCKEDNSEDRYDSVNGKPGQGSSRIYAVYDHDKSYPAYLITFN